MFLHLFTIKEPTFILFYVDIELILENILTGVFMYSYHQKENSTLF